MELRNRDRDAEPFVTKDGSTIREYLHTSRQSLAEASLEPGRSTTRHYHARAEEIYLVVEGGGVLEVDGETAEVGPGDAVLITPGAWHQLSPARRAHGSSAAAFRPTPTTTPSLRRLGAWPRRRSRSPAALLRSS